MAQTVKEKLSRRIQAARGSIEFDQVLKSVTVLDVFTCQWRKCDLGMIDGVIAAVEPAGVSIFRAAEVFDGQGKWAVPGFVDAHVHLESSLMLPRSFESAVLGRGTTTAICDPHELANVQGLTGIQYFLDQAQGLSLDLRVMLSSCVPATHLETNGGGSISAQDLLPLRAHPRSLGLAEMMNMPGVLGCDDGILDKLASFADLPMDGHCPLLRGRELSAYAAAGISSCHESSELEEAREKLTKGISVWIREGSVAKDLATLSPLLTLASSTSVGFCTDDRNPLDILSEGHIDFLVRESIRRGVAPEVAYRCASWSAARHYGLDRGIDRVGAIAPGYRGDLVVLDDMASVSIHGVLKSGLWSGAAIDLSVSAAKSSHSPGSPRDQSFTNSIHASVPDALNLEGPKGPVHVIGVLPGKIITRRMVLDSASPGVAKLSVLERYGNGFAPANAYVHGFGTALRGAIASSVGHDSHNLIVVGDSAKDMRAALAALIECGGGFCVVQGEQVLARLLLPVGGLMSVEDPETLKQQLIDLKKASRQIRCELDEPFLQLAFLSLPVIPSLKLTDRGLVDVEKFQIIDVRAS